MNQDAKERLQLYVKATPERRVFLPTPENDIKEALACIDRQAEIIKLLRSRS